MTGAMVRCPLCDGGSTRAPKGDLARYSCGRCGRFEVTGSAEPSEETLEVRRQLSGWVRDQNRAGAVPRITSNTLTLMASRPLPSVAERAERLLWEAVACQESLADPVDLHHSRFVAATYSKDHSEVVMLWQLMSQRGWMTKLADQGPIVRPTAKGHIAAEELTAKRGRSEEVFVAMSFSSELTSAYLEGFCVGIKRAGYVPIRVDRTEHVNRIDDEIVARIRRSAFVVADFTEQKRGVYFEAGFALGLNLPVIWACRADDIGNLHFDVRQYNCIDWKDEKELAKRLHLRIEAIVGRGPRAEQ